MRTAIRRVDTSTLVYSYVKAKRTVMGEGYTDEIAWQSKVSTQQVNAQSFVKEAAWVVLCSGMRESVVRRLFEPLSAVYHEWDPAKIVIDGGILSSGLEIFNNRRKLESIIEISQIVSPMNNELLRRRLLEDPENFLLTLPYIGPITWKHLAKNLGADIAKSDRHLDRIAKMTDRTSVQDLCSEIGSWLNEPSSVVDLVLWRWSVLHSSSCSRPDCDRSLSCLLNVG